MTRGRRVPAWFLPVAVVAVGVAAVALVNVRSSSGTQTAWIRFGTQDVHSLSFVGGDPSRVLFGHHGGLLASNDGGRTWSPLPIREDAMSMAPASDGSIFIAGHLVFTASRDGGATWTAIETNLPSLDIHGFTRDPADPARMWAYLATGGLWASSDFGATFTRVQEENVLFPVAVGSGESTRLLGVDARGLIESGDGGRSWSPLSFPPFAPVTSIAATPDGRVIYGGSPNGLFRSSDGGRTWSETSYQGSAFALATTPDGQTVAVVSRQTEFFRSSDGGQTWGGPGS